MPEPLPDDDRAHDIARRFHSAHYLRLDQRRLEHLATLGLDVAGKRVLEVGAGIGDLTGFFVDRGAEVTTSDGDPANVDLLRRRYPGLDVRLLDLERLAALDADEAPDRLGCFDVVFAYGVLYHLGKPAEALAALASRTRELLLVETCVFPYPGDDVHFHRELGAPENALHGTGCRPRRGWVMRELGRAFAHVYTTVAQPAHEEFPLDWTVPADDPWLTRAVFVASRAPLSSPGLTKTLPDRHTRST